MATATPTPRRPFDAPLDRNIRSRLRDSSGFFGIFQDSSVFSSEIYWFAQDSYAYFGIAFLSPGFHGILRDSFGYFGVAFDSPSFSSGISQDSIGFFRILSNIFGLPLVALIWKKISLTIWDSPWMFRFFGYSMGFFWVSFNSLRSLLFPSIIS